MKLKVNVKPMLIEFDIFKKEVFVNGEISNVYWVTKKIKNMDGTNSFKTLIVCKDFNNQNNGEDWIPDDNGIEYGFIHNKEIPNIQFLGFWVQKCLRNVNNYYDRTNSDIN